MVRFQHHLKHLLCAIHHSVVLIFLVAGNDKVLMVFVGTNGLSEDAVCFHVLSNSFALGLRFTNSKC